MRRSEVEKWIAANGGQSDIQSEDVLIDNPSSSEAARKKTPKIKIKKVTWVANNGQRLTIIDPGPPEGMTAAEAADDPGEAERRRAQIEGMTVTDPQTGEKRTDPDYQVVSQGDPTPPAPSTAKPGDRAKDAEDQRESEYNAHQPNDPQYPGATGRYETHEAKRARERQEQNDKDTADLRAAEAASRKASEARADRGEDRADRTENRGIAADERQAAAQEASTKLGQDRLGLDREKYDFDRGQANAPKPLGTPDDTQQNIAIWDPVTGSVKGQSNPAYDEAKAAAAQKAKDLQLAMQAGELNQKQATAEYDRWYKANIEVPFLAAAEARAQAKEKRDALQMREQARQVAAQQQIDTARVGQQAAGQALSAEESLNPYRVGPTFGADMSSAINSLAAGGTMAGPSASAGIHFSPDAFSYQAPNFAKIAKKAAAQAVKHISSYKPGDDDYETGDYTGIPMPGQDTFKSAPTPPSPIDLTGIIDDFKKKYAPAS